MSLQFLLSLLLLALNIESTLGFFNTTINHTAFSNLTSNAFQDATENVDQDTIWQCLCKGAMMEYYIRRGIYEVNDPNGAQHPPGPGNPNSPSGFQDLITDLMYYTTSGPALASSNNEQVLEVAKALEGLNVPN